MGHILAFFCNSWLNDLKDIGQGQRSLCVTHPLISVITCAQYGKNPSRTIRAVERTLNDLPYFSRFFFLFSVMAEWPRRYRSRSKFIMCDTPSHASDHLCLIWKESIQKCRNYGADTEFGMDGRTDGVKPMYPPTTFLCGYTCCRADMTRCAIF